MIECTHVTQTDDTFKAALNYLFFMFRRILHTSVDTQNPPIYIPLFNLPRSKPPHSEISRSLLSVKKKRYSIDLNLQKSRIVLHPKENRNSPLRWVSALTFNLWNGIDLHVSYCSWLIQSKFTWRIYEWTLPMNTNTF